MNTLEPATDRTREGPHPDNRAVSPRDTPRHRWIRIGSARRMDDGAIEFDLEYGSYPGIYQIGSSEARDLLMLGVQVPLTVYSPETKRRALIGSARWSSSGRMLLLDLYGSSRSGTCQIPGVQLVKRYLDKDDRPVDVVTSPERSV